MKSNLPPLPLIEHELPGPNRRRTPCQYFYRQTFRNPDEHANGCVATWDVLGGREVYQIALERDAAGRLQWHCTCADAVYRAERFGRACKHVVGLNTSQS